ncbi:MAG: hypothetical protein WBQ21_12170 [Solirubrobacteraceae bacterium]
MAAKAMVETDDAADLSSEQPTEPVVLVDIPNAASSRLICLACWRAELVNDSDSAGVRLAPAGIEMMGIVMEVSEVGTAGEGAGTTSFAGSL